MSISNSLPLNFSCSFDELIGKSIEKEAFLRRDLADLLPRGITLIRINSFADLRTTFIGIPTNISERSGNSISFSTRDAKSMELMVAVNEVNGIAKNTFGKTSSEYKSFDIKGLTHFNADEMYIYSNNVFVKATFYFTRMEPKGLTNAMLTNITTLRAQLIILIAAPPVLVADSEAMTVLRRNTANMLFDEMRSMCDTAIVYYDKRNPTKKADYFIYDIASTTIIRKGILNPGKQKSPKSTGITGDTPIKIKVKSGGEVQVFYSMVKGTYL